MRCIERSCALRRGSTGAGQDGRDCLGRVGLALLDADDAQARSVHEALEPVERLHAELDDRAVDLIARRHRWRWICARSWPCCG